MDTSKPVSLVKALVNYFEMTPTELMADFKKLTDKDKADFRKMLTELGYTITA